MLNSDACGPAPTAAPAAPATELAAIKARQQATWASGDYAVIGTTLQIVGETLCEAVDLRAGSKVLDVAAGNGNCSLAAARRWCEVTSTDYVPALLDEGRRRAEGERLAIRFQEADAEHLPFDDQAFDVVLSSFGVMFTPDHHRAASELLRVCRRGGRIGLANWTPRSFVGQLFTVVGRHVAPPPALVPPSRWGSADYVQALLGAEAKDVQTTPRDFTFRYRSVDHWIEVFRAWYGPVHRAFAGLPADGHARLTRDLRALVASCNTSGDDTVVIPSEYLEVVITKQ